MLIESFYSRDDISRQAPGKQDVKSVKNSHTGKRELIQKRHMVLTIGEAYQEFNKCYPDTEVGKPKFYSLRPPYVLPVADTPHNVCVCRYHANFNYILQSIVKVVPSFPRL